MIPVHGGPPTSKHVQRRNLDSLSVAPPQHQSWAKRVSRFPCARAPGTPLCPPLYATSHPDPSKILLLQDLPQFRGIGVQGAVSPPKPRHLLGLSKGLFFSLRTYPPLFTLLRHASTSWGCAILGDIGGAERLPHTGYPKAEEITTPFLTPSSLIKTCL